jgi:hypothetical protein
VSRNSAVAQVAALRVWEPYKQPEDKHRDKTKKFGAAKAYSLSESRSTAHQRMPTMATARGVFKHGQRFFGTIHFHPNWGDGGQRSLGFICHSGRESPSRRGRFLFATLPPELYCFGP